MFLYLWFQTEVNDYKMEPVSKHGTAYNSFILVFFLISFVLAILLAFCSLPNTDDTYQFQCFLILIARSVGGFCAVSIALLISWSILRYKHWICMGYVVKPVRKWTHSNIQLVLYTDHNGNKEPVHGGHSSWLEILLFGIGSVSYLVSNLVKVASEINVDKIQVVMTLVTLKCCILFILFLKLYNGNFLKNTRLFHYSIAVMIGAIVCEWLSITLSPLWEYSAGNSTNSVSSRNLNISMSYAAKKENFELVLETIQNFLQPFFVEFLSISAACLLELWQTMRRDVCYQIEYKSELSNIESQSNSQVHTESTIILEANEDHLYNYETIRDDEALLLPRSNVASSYNSKEKCHKFQTSFVIGISICAFVFFVVVSSLQVVPMLPKINIGKETLRKLSSALAFGPLLIILLVALYKLNNTNICMQKSKLFTSTDYLLLFTCCAMSVNQILLIFVLIGQLLCFKNTDTFWTILQVFYWVVSISNAWVQTKVLMTAQCIHRSKQSIPRFLRLMLIYIMSLNIGHWLCDSIEHKWVENNHLDRASELISMFGESQAKTIELIFLPIWDIYCFHSAIVAYNLLKKPKH